MHGFDADEYLAQANEAILCIPIIESREAVEQIGEIVSVDGIDGIVIGPMDLSMSLECFKRFSEPVYLEAVDKARKACRKYGKAMGTGCYSLEHAQHCAGLGDTLLLVAGDDTLLASESRRTIGELRKLGVAAS